MNYPYVCDPNKSIHDNLKGAIDTNICQNAIGTKALLSILNAVLDDLNQMVKHKPLKKHRLTSSYLAAFNNIMDICLWYMRPLDPDDSRSLDVSRPKPVVSPERIYRILFIKRKIIKRSAGTSRDYADQIYEEYESRHGDPWFGFSARVP